MSKSTARTAWKVIAVCGVLLAGLGLAAFSIDYVWIGQFELIEKHYDGFGLAILIGCACLVFGLIGLATQLNRAGRARVAKLALLLPPAVVVLADLSMGSNMHGVFPLFVISSAPVMATGLVVAIMAARSPAESPMKKTLPDG